MENKNTIELTDEELGILEELVYAEEQRLITPSTIAFYRVIEIELEIRRKQVRSIISKLNKEDGKVYE